MAQQLPNRLQSTLSTLLLLALSLVLAPVSFVVSLFFSLTHAGAKATRPSLHRSQPTNGRANGHTPPSSAQRTVLVNGARMQKSLAICRTFARNGWKVVLVEEQGWGNLAATRFSNSVSKFHLLPSSSLPASKSSTAEKGEHAVTPYIEALVRIALSEKVDLFFPCSGAGSTGQDAVAAALLLGKDARQGAKHDPDARAGRGAARKGSFHLAPSTARHGCSAKRDCLFLSTKPSPSCRAKGIRGRSSSAPLNSTTSDGLT